MPRSHSTTWSRCRPVSGSHRCSGMKASANPMAAISTMRWSMSVGARPPVLGAVGIGAVREPSRPNDPSASNVPPPATSGTIPQSGRAYPSSSATRGANVRPEAAEAHSCTARREVTRRAARRGRRPRAARRLWSGAGCPPSGSPTRRAPVLVMRSARDPRRAPRERARSPARKRRTSATARSPMREISFPKRAGDVRRQHHVGKVVERRIGRQGSGSGVSTKRVEPPGDALARQCVGVDERPTRGVEQPRPVVHASQAFGVDEVMGRRQLGCVHGDDVGPREEIVELHAR